MSLADTSIRRPVFAWMLMIALIVFGGVAWLYGLGVSQYPDVDLPVVTVRLTLQGAAPEIMESDVVDIAESSLVQVEGITDMNSACRAGSATITLEFELNRNIDAAIQDVQTRLAQAMRLLPRDLDPPIVTKQNPEDAPILWLAVYGTRPLREISDYVRNTLRDRFQTVPGVGDIFMGGFLERNVRVWLDAHRLEAHDLSVDEVMAALAREHVEVPAGRIESANREFSVRAEGEAMDLKALRDLILADRDGAQVRLADVALIEDGFEDRRRLARVNGLPAMGLGIRKLRGANAIKVGDGVKARLEEVRKSLPAGLDIVVNNDTTVYVKDAIQEIAVAIALAVLLTALVCRLFLSTWSSTFNVVLAIPTSLIGTLGVMYFMGFTINTFTMLALTLAVGIVVDDAIMVMENIWRHAEMGKDKVRASADGAREITFAATVATAAIMAIFLPIAFMKGIVGKFLYQFGMVLSVAVALSLLEALTITPARTSQLMNVRARPGALSRFMERIFRALATGYRRLLHPALRLRYLIILAAAGLFAFTYATTRQLFSSWETIPPQDQSRINLRIIAPVGSSLDYTDGRIRQVEKILADQPEILRYFIFVGGFGGGEVDTANAFVTLVPPRQRKLSQRQFIQKIRADLRRIPGITALVSDPSTNMPGQGGRSNAQVNFYIQGPDWDELAQVSQQILERMRAQDVFTDVDSDYRLGAPEIRVLPDRKKAADLGVSMENIGRSVSALVGGLRVVKFKDQGRRYDVRVRLQAGQRLSPSDIERVRVRNNRGELVSLADVVTTRVEPALLAVTRMNRSRAITLSCNPGPGSSPTQAIAAAERLSSELLPKGTSFNITGSSKSDSETLQSLVLALVLGIVIAYMILGAQFNSFLHPITVLVALPFSLTGAVVAIMWSGHTLNIFSMIGIVLLMGIVKKNSILLVDFTNQRRAEGLPIREALLTACPTRLRPILMTSISTIVGAVPAALALDLSRFGIAGGGVEMRAPMAVAVIGGITVSTFLTLFVVPSLYMAFEDLARLLGFGKKASPVALEPREFSTPEG